MNEQDAVEAKRLEQLWGGEFGDAYTQRNAHSANGRGLFWEEILTAFPATQVLEVGCNLGANLHWIEQHIAPHCVYGVDINDTALQELRRRLPAVNAVYGSARQLLFREEWFDLVFTMGVLIHQSEATLKEVMTEIVRCSNRYVLCAEYFSEETVEVPYRGQDGALFKRDYGKMYQEQFAELRLVKQGFLSRAEGWDDVTYWLFEKMQGKI